MPTFSKRGRIAAALIGAAGVGMFLAPAIAQDRPESILPPGFGEPAPTPPASPRPDVPATVQPLPPSLTTPTPTPSATPSATPTPDAALLAMYEMPLAARRSLSLVGPAGESAGGLSPDAFGAADGRYIEALMRRTAAPLPSRWLSILLRRTLAARLTTPRDVNGADFAAERAWLLLRMGEAHVARAVVQSVDTLNVTPKLRQVAMNAMLATGDPAGLCPLAGGEAVERGWVLARAMCAALEGSPAAAGRQLTQARRRGVAEGVDLLLAQKVAGAGGQGRQAVTIEWDGVVQLTSWRWGLATATGVVVPDMLYATLGPQVRYWHALSPAVPGRLRVASADLAAAQGVLSSAALVDLYSSVAADDEASAAIAGVATDLRTAYTERDPQARLAALKGVWGNDARVPHGRLVLTARAVARLPVGGAQGDADLIVASLLTAGLDRSAARWRTGVGAGSDGWAMIALADPDARGTLAYASLASYAGSGEARLKQRLLFAGLAGLGRLEAGDIARAAQALDVQIGADNSWTRALDRAAAAGEQGTVVLLSAIAMQTSDWRGVPPEALYRILGALRAVGLGGEARMIAAEAIARA